MKISRLTAALSIMAALLLAMPAAGLLAREAAKQAPAPATKTAKAAGKMAGLFDIFKKNPLGSFSLWKREEPKDMDTIVDYLTSRGVRGTPVASGILERGILEFCFGLRGIAADKFVFINKDGSVLYFIFEFATKVEAEAAVPVIVSCVSAVSGLEEGELFAVNKYRFVIGTKAASKKAVAAITQF